jgi:hypothetical protein
VRAFCPAFSAAIVSAAAIVRAQEQPDPRALIPSSTLNATAQRVSAAQARAHTIAEKK